MINRRAYGVAESLELGEREWLKMQTTFLHCRVRDNAMEVSDSSKVLCIRMVLFSIYVLAGAAVFQAIESQEQLQEIRSHRDTRREILQKYNITAIDADRWMETFPSTVLGNEGFLEWNFGNSFLFAMVVITTIGKITDCLIL